MAEDKKSTEPVAVSDKLFSSVKDVALFGIEMFYLRYLLVL